MPTDPPSRDDGVTPTCPLCGRTFTRTGRRVYCGPACRQAAHRRRHQPPSEPAPLPPSRPRRPVTVYACPICEQRYLGEQRCPDCNTFCLAVGIGGQCPTCEEPVAINEFVSARKDGSPGMSVGPRLGCGRWTCWEARG